jgi:hypothetical protein
MFVTTPYAASLRSNVPFSRITGAPVPASDAVIVSDIVTFAYRAALRHNTVNK